MVREREYQRKKEEDKTPDFKINKRFLGFIILGCIIIFIKFSPEGRINSLISHITGTNTNYTEMFSEIKGVILKHTMGNKIFIMPIDDKITSPFGIRKDPITNIEKKHTGIDINAPLNTPVKASSKGRVTRVEENKFYGKFIMIEHENNIETLYGHLNFQDVTIGQNVNQNDIIGKSGTTGNSTGPHLHFEIRKDKIPVNPKDYLL